jgi:hypothetical protein
MSGFRKHGPLCGSWLLNDTDEGTLCLWDTPYVPPVGTYLADSCSAVRMTRTTWRYFGPRVRGGKPSYSLLRVRSVGRGRGLGCI